MDKELGHGKGRAGIWPQVSWPPEPALRQCMVPLPGGQAVDTGQANDHGYSLGEDQ